MDNLFENLVIFIADNNLFNFDELKSFGLQGVIDTYKFRNIKNVYDAKIYKLEYFKNLSEKCFVKYYCYQQIDNNEINQIAINLLSFLVSNYDDDMYDLLGYIYYLLSYNSRDIQKIKFNHDIIKYVKYIKFFLDNYDKKTLRELHIDIYDLHYFDYPIS
jgi:hypothetical protein